MNKKSEILARLIYPKPKGTLLRKKELMVEDAVVQLFDACQIFQALIYAKGWAFLHQHYGLGQLYEIDKKSGWFDTSHKGEWYEAVLDWALISGYNLQTGHFGIFEKNLNIFKLDDGGIEMIDWQKFHLKGML